MDPIKHMTLDALDRAVATFHEPKPIGGPVDILETESLLGWWVWESDSQGWRVAGPPSRSIATAWRLMEQMTEIGGTPLGKTMALHFTILLARQSLWALTASEAALFITRCYYQARSGADVVIVDD